MIVPQKKLTHWIINIHFHQSNSPIKCSKHCSHIKIELLILNKNFVFIVFSKLFFLYIPSFAVPVSIDKQ